jgi:hypothetical protein
MIIINISKCLTSYLNVASLRYNYLIKKESRMLMNELSQQNSSNYVNTYNVHTLIFKLHKPTKLYITVNKNKVRIRFFKLYNAILFV